jgi:hypothetical protein
MNTRQIIDYALDDDAKEMRESLYASIFDRVNSAIEAKKQEVAHSLLGGMPMGESVDHSCEDGHEDEVEDKKLVKKMVKKTALKTEEDKQWFKKKAKKMVKGLRSEGYDLSDLSEETVVELANAVLNDEE